jgi:iron complex transport system substrate-binding protein
LTAHRTRPIRALFVGVLVATLAIASGCSNSGNEADRGPGTRTVTHAAGTTEVSQNPQRIVALEPLELDTIVALGMVPVGAAVANNVTEVPKYLGVSGVKTVGTVSEPSVEAIAALKPDLILGTQSRHSSYYERLSKIAPTVFIKTQADPWQENAVRIGDALNRKADVEKLLTDYNDRCASIKSQYKTAGKTAQMVRPRGAELLSLYGPTSFAGSALQCVGLTIPNQPWTDGGLQADISLENLSNARADYVFVTSQKVDDPMSIPERIRDNKAWFPTVTIVDTAYWVSGVGPKGGMMVLDDIEKFLKTQQ